MTDSTLHEFRRGPNAVAAALAAADAFCRDSGTGACPALAVIVEELVINLIDHGTPDDADDLIGMSLSRDVNGIRLTLTDGGAPFDPRTATTPGELPPERGGGAGLALVRAWSRIELYTRIDGRNLLQLTIPLDGC